MVLVFGIFITARNTVECLTWTGQNNADKRSKAADVTARTQNQAFLLSARAFHRTLKDHADLKFTGIFLSSFQERTQYTILRKRSAHKIMKTVRIKRNAPSGRIGIFYNETELRFRMHVL